jgi:hypothetical protein
VYKRQYQTGTLVNGYTMDIYGGTPFRFNPNSTVEVAGWVNETNAIAGLTRKRLRNSSGTASIVDMQIENSLGSAYVGVLVNGTLVMDNRTSAPDVMLQQSGASRLGVTSGNKLLVGVTTSTTASGGAFGAIPNAAGYIEIVNSGGTPIGKIPYVGL